MDRFRGLPRTRVLGLEVPLATTWRSRLLGLSFIAHEHAGEGLMIPRCRSVHTFGMRFPLDLIFLDEDGRVVELRRSVPPGHIVRCLDGASVLELPSPAI